MLPLENITIDEALMRSVTNYPDNQALSYGERHWTYTEFNAEVDTIARKLLNMGVKHGTHVGIWCESEPNAVFSLFAVERIGAVAIMVNTSLKEKEVASVLERTDVEYLLIGDGFKDVDYRLIAKTFENTLMELKNVIYIGLSGDNFGFTIFDEVKEADDESFESAKARVKPEDDGLILFTSGTTSQPRAVVGTQYSRANSGVQQAHDLMTTPADRFCVAMPIFHCFCLSVNVCAALFSGACLCLPKSRHIKDLLDTVETEHCTVLSCVPALYHAIIERGDLANHDISSLRTGIIGGSMYSSNLFEEIEDAFGITLLSSLGQTEATAGITVANFDDPLGERAGTVGHIMDHIEYRFVERFELLVRGYVVMKEYYKDPEATAAAIDKDGWLHTGDTGFVNENGNLILTGRIKDLIIRGGENISPREIEAVLDDDDRVAECKAVGVYDSHYGEEVALAIIRNRAVAPITKDEVLEKLRHELANYKVPRYVVFLEDFPRTNTGKTRTTELKRKVEGYLGL